MNSRWIKKDRIYTLEDSDGKTLLEVEDRTCNGSYVTDSILNKLASKYFQDLERENVK